MPRIPRRDCVSPEYFAHVIARGNNKMCLFLNATDYRRYELKMLEVAEKYAVEIKRYVLMPNHVHMLVRPGAKGLSQFMHSLQLSYSKFYSFKYGHIGHVWQDRFKSITITDDSYLETCERYIILNPVRAGLVHSAEEWPFMGTLVPWVPGTKNAPT